MFNEASKLAGTYLVPSILFLIVINYNLNWVKPFELIE